ncbi:tautomerase family protein [Edaphobacter dinghuensis]|uniref:Tautomerase YusQ n=1 Tax=Edaphobacter dinghuensis TaxID=1560005 RepID=A0A917HGA4_9BACT|nr:tautomerase family protein [Edaphobacter dinghuensis]GGG77902.1 putative tautomerase YusQ [Edaphobacter dinghuensis]
MPLVRVSMKIGRSSEQKSLIGDAIYDAMRETLNVPENDRFQILTEHAGDGLVCDPHYLGIERTDQVLFIQVFLRKGRTTEMKQAFYRRTAELLHQRVGQRMEDVFITLSENDLPDWSFGNGIAQYVS